MKNKVIKNLIAPLQQILMEKKMCPGCTRSLSKGKVVVGGEIEDIIQCECGRIFVHSKEFDSFRRALDEDLK